LQIAGFLGMLVNEDGSMPQINIDEVKRLAAELSQHKLPPIEIPRSSAALTKNRTEIEKLLKSYFDKTGLAVDKLNKLTATRQTERRKLFATQVAERAKNLHAAEIGFRQAMENRREALQLLSTPFQSTFVILDKPFLIWQTPHQELDIFIDWNIESMNSSVKISVDKNAGADNTFFNFYFIWANESQFAAVVNVNTSLVLNGDCVVTAATGIFSGYHNSIGLTGFLNLIRNTGWGTDPTTGASNDQTSFPLLIPQLQTMAFLDSHGGGLFSGDHDRKEKTFNFQPFGLSCDQIVIPAGATILFEVSLLVQYGFEHGLDISDNVRIDFASDALGNRVICPLVALELLTAPPVLTAT
jgi:hypothetical protein